MSIATTEMNEAPQAQKASSIAMIRTLGGISLISGLLLALVYQATFDIIEQNKQKAVEAAVFSVVPGIAEGRTPVPYAVNPETQELKKLEHGEEAPEGFSTFYVGFGENGELVGVALPAAGQGYGDVIRILYGYSPSKQTVTGIKILESKETPGLGDKIAKEPFIDNFRAMDVSLDDDKGALLHPVEFVKSGCKTDPWQVDGIAGATISSKAITNMLKDSTGVYVPLIQNMLDQLKEGGSDAQ